MAGNQRLYGANRQSPIFGELTGILRKASGLADGVAEPLAPLTDHIQVALIFGSVARGSEMRASDVDVLIIGAVDYGRVVDALYPTQQRLAREVNPKVFTRREWNATLKEKSPFVLEALSRERNGPERGQVPA